MALLFQNIVSTFFVALLCISLSLSPFALAKSSGTATFYTKYVPSACYGNKQQGVMIAAGNAEIYEGGKGCGQHYKVTCVGGANKKGSSHPCKGGKSVVVKIVDLCPNCQGTLDLSKQAFSKIADTSAGVISISYQKV